jgi:hypothetical protein
MLWLGEQVWRRELGAASSEAETHSRGRQTLERGADSPEGAPGPRARRRPARGVPRPTSWWAVAASLGRGPFHFGLRPQRSVFFWGSWRVRLRFIIFRKGGFPRLLGDPYGCPRHT